MIKKLDLKKINGRCSIYYLIMYYMIDHIESNIKFRILTSLQ